MKNTLLITALLFSLKSYSQTVPDYVPTSGLDAWYSFSGNANDESGGNNDGTVNGATLTTGKQECPNTAYSFNGTNNTINLANPFLGGTQNSAFTFYVLVSFNSINMFHQVWSKYLFWGEVALTITDQNQIRFFGANSITGNKYSSIYSETNVIQENIWYNIVVVFENSIGTIYLNGTPITTNLQWTAQGGTIISTSELEASYNFAQDPNTSKIGTYDNANYFNGKIDALGVWNRALTSTEIEDLNNSQIITVDNTVTQSGNTLTATQTGASYQWLDCDNGNAAISGATNQSYSPGVSGNFAVEVTVTDGSCEVTETSACQSLTFVGLEENTPNNFSVYPNPTKNTLTIQLNQLSNTGYTITDQLGKVVMEGNISSQKQVVDVSSLSNGIYFIKIAEVTQKFVKE
jgi:hypothetical protein